MAVGFLTRRATFSAAHRLHSSALSADENKRVFGKCNWENGHGHNYVLEVTLRGEIDPQTGMIANLTEIKDAINELIIARLDHRNLNLDVKEFATLNPTVENIAVVCWKFLRERLSSESLFEIKLYETENNIAIYRGD